MPTDLSLTDIFQQQNKMFMHPKAETLLEDFAVKCIQKGFSMMETVNAIEDFYNQCKEVAIENYNRAVNILTA